MILQSDTEAWRAARVGRVTASRISDVIASGRGSAPSVSRANYLAELVCERLTGRSAESGYVNAAMQHGLDTEPEARSAYELLMDITAEPPAFVLHPHLMGGASTDGFVGEDGVLEIKCPQPAAHLATLQTQRAPTKYAAQIQWQLACTGRSWCDFVSYQPAMPEPMRLFRQRVGRDEQAIAGLEAEVRRFLSEVEAAVQDLQRRYG